MERRKPSHVDLQKKTDKPVVLTKQEVQLEEQTIPEEVKEVDGIGVVHEDIIPIRPLFSRRRKTW